MINYIDCQIFTQHNDYVFFISLAKIIFIIYMISILQTIIYSMFKPKCKITTVILGLIFA
jgi:hypothetical protein